MKCLFDTHCHYLFKIPLEELGKLREMASGYFEKELKTLLKNQLGVFDRNDLDYIKKRVVK